MSAGDGGIAPIRLALSGPRQYIFREIIYFY
jgi:hypothetical protein